MPSPVTPSTFQSLIPTATGSTCDKLLRALFQFPAQFLAWYSYVYNENGSFTAAFSSDLCAINCAALPGGGAFDAPTLIWSGVEAAQVTMSWGAITGAAYYELVRATSDNVNLAQPVSITTLLNFTDTTVSADTWYFYWVRARTAVSLGNYSSSKVAYASASPPLTLSAPSISTTTNKPDYCKITWPAVTGASGYEVRRNTANNFAAATILGTTNGLYWDDFGGAFGVSYYYFAKATNASVSSAGSTGVVGVRT